jgi:glycosyltransferase involved in cell wall biosynthesis
VKKDSVKSFARVAAYLGSRRKKLLMPLYAVGIRPEFVEADQPTRGGRLYALLSLAAIISRSDVLLLDYPGIGAFIASLLAKYRGVKVMLRLRGDIWVEARHDSWLRRHLRVFFAEWLIKTADVVVFVSEYLKRRVIDEENVCPRRAFVIYAPLDEAFLQNNRGDDHASVVCNSKTVFVSATNFDFKGKAVALSRFMPVLDRLLHKGIDCEWLVLGNGRYRDIFIRELARFPSVERCCAMKGWVDDVKLWYGKAHVAVYLSDEDTMSNALSEAMVMGMPVIVNAYQPLCELVRDGVNAIVIDASQDALEEDERKVMALINGDVSGVSLGACARKDAIERHDPIRIGQQLLNAIADVTRVD